MNSFVKAASVGFIALGLWSSTALAQDSWWKAAAQPYQGATIRGISESTPASKYVEQVLGPKFTEETGIKVEVEATSLDQMYDKSIKDMEDNTGIYDFVYIEQDIVYTYLARDFLVDITKSLADNAEIASPDFNPENFTTFLNYFKDPTSGNVMGVPMEAFIKPYLYRKDLFEDPEIQKAFKDATGADLKPAATHDEYTQIAKFFTEYGADKELWGTTVQASSSHPAAFYEFFESIAPTFGVYNWGIDGTTFAATEANGGQMNSAAAKKALNYWVGLLQYAPPESTSSTWDEVAGTFAAGRAAQGLVYGENAAWIATDESKSTVVGKVGVALPPVEAGVIEAAGSGKGYIGYYDGGAFGIPHSSKNKDASLLFLQYIGQASVQTDWALAGSRIVMNSTYDDPKIVDQDKKMNGYYTLMREDGKLFAGAPPFPFHSQVLQAVAPFIYKAIVGEIKPDDALDQAASAAEAELVKLGYRK